MLDWHALIEIRCELQPRAQEELARTARRILCTPREVRLDRATLEAQRLTQKRSAPYESETMAMSTLSITMTTSVTYMTKSMCSKSLVKTSRSKSPSIPMLNTVRRVSDQLPKGWRVDERRARETGLMHYKG